MIETIGNVGALLLAYCALPQAIVSLVNGNSHGLSHGFLWTWYLGEILMLFYVVTTVSNLPLILNYGSNTFLLSIIIYYKYFPRR